VATTLEFISDAISVTYPDNGTPNAAFRQHAATFSNDPAPKGF
jgi:hypothetical protein